MSLVILTGTLLGAGAIPSAVGYLAQVSSFSLAIALLGLLTLISPLLLRTGHAGSRPEAM
ncbi:MAG TPA: hypothetical protein VMG58_09175 [Candidatus Sulfotelmatobacter sp.]|nr:hypothetical protein [Candidatus Sulfotelmatobacter sp.]